MMVYSINASGLRCYHPAWSASPKVTAAPPPSAAPDMTIDPPESPAAPMVTAEPPESPADATLMVDPLVSPADPNPTTAPPGGGILTPGVTLDITMHDSSLFVGELITLGSYVPVRLKQNSDSYVAGQVVRLNSKFILAIA